MKKRYLFLLLVFGLVLLDFKFTNVKAEIVDVTPPVINSISLDKTTYNAGDHIKVTLDLHDDVSGVYNFQLRFIKKDELSSIYSWENNIVISCSYAPNYNTEDESSYTCNTYQIPLEIEDNEYYYQMVSISDWNGNTTYYKDPNVTISDSNFNYIDNNFGLSKIRIINTNVDNTKVPIIRNITLDKTIVDPNEKIIVTAEIDDNDDVMSTNIVYRMGNKQIGTELYKDHDNIYKGEIKTNVPGKYHFINLEVYTKNKKVYSKSGNDIDEKYHYITVNGEYDTNPPTLKKIEFSKNEVKVPSYIKASIYYEDNIAIDASAIITIYNKKTNKLAGYINNEGRASETTDGIYVNNLFLSQYLGEGEYYVQRVFLDDGCGNSIEYIYGDNLKEIYSFKVVSDVNADANTSTTSNELNNIIENSKDDAVIAINSTRNPIIKSNIFDSIKDTNKRIVIESNGIQWIFNGKDIINDSKDINTKVNFYKIENTDNELSDIVTDTTLVIEFADNGLLPGKCKIRIKADYALRNYLGEKGLYAYFYDEETQMLSEVLTKIDLTDDSYYEFFINHNSTYILTSKKPKTQYISNTKDEVIELTEEELEDYKIDNDKIITTDNDKKIDSNANSNKSSKSNIFLIIVSIIIGFSVGVISIFIYTFIKKKKIKKVNE